MDCDFTVNADGFWHCTRKGCEKIHPIKCDRPPGRRCRAGATARDRWPESELRKLAKGKWFRNWSEVEHNLAVCRGGCEHFRGTSCTLTGHLSCGQRRGWFKRLLTYGCTGALPTPR